ncbi:hypothetical protein [Paraburkholderia azotifigens]|uniref:Uncharacterized protein n=1 Tax=Paraburkholderia azotifigens TaxID=2057004 RepID=A0A5C6VPM0_9BURK|nr:hypothetical protein [Paraburkholderia azotifigens]TXC86819.1 hypothetical protein FRZ40_04070 [Paraburkholderia azotifigens]
MTKSSAAGSKVDEGGGKITRNNSVNNAVSRELRGIPCAICREKNTAALQKMQAAVFLAAF